MERLMMIYEDQLSMGLRVISSLSQENSEINNTEEIKEMMRLEFLDTLDMLIDSST